MYILKVVEISGNSPVSFEDAVSNVVKESSKTMQNIKSVYIKDTQAKVKNNAIAEYRVTTKVCFGIEED